MKAIVLLMLLSGCATQGDVIFHTLNVADGVQTSQYQYNCMHESNSFTVIVLGEEPSTGDTAAWTVATSFLYQWVVDKHEDKKWINWFRWTAIGLKGYTVANNERIRRQC